MFHTCGFPGDYRLQNNLHLWFNFSLYVWFQVNTNGVISFLGAVSQYTPAPFSLGDNRRLISPFWGDMDTRNGGTVLYRESIDPVLLDRATKDVRRAFLNHQRFSASWIFIVTWDRVAFYGADGNLKNKVIRTNEVFACHRHRTSDLSFTTTELFPFFFTRDALQIADPSSKQDTCHVRTLYRSSSFSNIPRSWKDVKHLSPLHYWTQNLPSFLFQF